MDGWGERVRCVRISDYGYRHPTTGDNNGNSRDSFVCRVTSKSGIVAVLAAQQLQREERLLRDDTVACDPQLGGA